MQRATIREVADLAAAAETVGEHDGLVVSVADLVQDHALAALRGPRTRHPGWAHWHSTTRLHGYLAYIPPVEYEHAFLRCPPDRP